MQFAQEASINALRHSASDEVRVSIQTDLEASEVVIQVSNDIPGGEASSNPQGRGPHNMRKHAGLTRGILTLNLAPVLVECTLRLPLLSADDGLKDH